MADPYVRTVGTVEDIDGVEVTVGVDYDTVTLRFASPLARFTQAGMDRLEHSLVAACWEAGANAERMRQEDDVTPQSECERNGEK